MSKIKEKKLNLIKSEIEDIKKFITSNDKSDGPEHNEKNNYDNIDDTFTLTEIVQNNIKDVDLVEIKKDLQLLKSAINNNENLLKEILSKIQLAHWR